MSDLQFIQDTIFPKLGLFEDTQILVQASKYAILLETELFNYIPNKILPPGVCLEQLNNHNRELVERTISCLLGIAAHFHCIYHTTAFQAKYRYHGEITLHQKYNASVNQLVSITLMSQAFGTLFQPSKPHMISDLSKIYDVISNYFYQPQCRDYQDILTREERMHQRISTTVDKCRDIFCRFLKR